jgi:hypothetical protein
MRRNLGSAIGSRAWALATALLVAVLVSAALGSSVWARGSALGPAAHAARTVSLSETAHLETSKREIPGSEISESGRAVGTYNAPVIAGLTIHAHSVTAIVTVYLKGGSITASANANFKFTGEVGNFQGTLTVGHSTGTYRHATGHLTFRGAINRNSLKMWAVTSGPVKY